MERKLLRLIMNAGDDRDLDLRRVLLAITPGIVDWGERHLDLPEARGGRWR